MTRIVGEPQIEEGGVTAGTYLFFEFRDDLSGRIILGLLSVVLVEMER